MISRKKFNKVIGVIYGIALIALLGVAFIWMGEPKDGPLFPLVVKIFLAILFIAVEILFLGIGFFCFGKAYEIIKKPMTDYREEPGLLEAKDGSGPSRLLNKKYDIVADKIWNIAAYGALGCLTFLSGIMILKDFLVDPLIIFFSHRAP